MSCEGKGTLLSDLSVAMSTTEDGVLRDRHLSLSHSLTLDSHGQRRYAVCTLLQAACPNSGSETIN